MLISDEHKQAMTILPPSGRWKTVAQLMGHTLLSQAKCEKIYDELAGAGFLEAKSLPIIHGLSGDKMFVKEYRISLTCLMAWRKATLHP